MFTQWVLLLAGAMMSHTASGENVELLQSRKRVIQSSLEKRNISRIIFFFYTFPKLESLLANYVKIILQCTHSAKNGPTLKPVCIYGVLLKVPYPSMT